MELELAKDAQAILDRARDIALHNHAAAVEPEHVLLALLIDVPHLASMLERRGLDVMLARGHLATLVAGGVRDELVVLPRQGSQTRSAMEAASREAWRAGHRVVSARDLLLGLIEHSCSPATTILSECGADLAAVRRDLGTGPRSSTTWDPPLDLNPPGPRLADLLDEQVLELLKAALEVASRRDYRRVHPHHLLTAMLAREEGLATQVFRAVELEPEEMREEAARWVASDAEGMLVGGVRVSEGVVGALRDARKRAKKRGAKRAQPADVLMAMLEGGDPFLPTLLERFHVPPRDLRHELFDLGGPDSVVVLREAALFAAAARQTQHEEELDRALARAREEAETNASDHVGTEHLLLALVLDTRSVAARALHACGIDLMRARELIEPATWGRSAPQGELPLTPRADRAVHVARLEARHLDQRVGTGHLLLALYWQRKGTASRLLQELGVVPSRIRKEVLAATTPEGAGERRAHPPLTTRARLTLARAARLVADGGPAVNRGHLLQALLSHLGGLSHVVLRTIRVDRAGLLATAEQWAGETESAGDFASSIWGILGSAWEEAERQGLGHVGTGHLLYGVLAASQGRLGTIFGSAPPASSVRAVLDRLLR